MNSITRNLSAGVLLIILCLANAPHTMAQSEARDKQSIAEPDYHDPPDQYQVPKDEELESALLPDSFLATIIGLREEKHLRDDFDLNPDGALMDFNEYVAVTALDLEWNPQLSDMLTVRSRGMLIHEEIDDSANTGPELMEAYLQWQNSDQTLVMDIGKIKVEWGSGYAWNPVQVVVMPVDSENSIIDDNEGVSMFRLVWNRPLVTATFLVADLEADAEGSDNPGQLAAKLSLNLEPWEMELVHHQSTETDPVNGISFSGLLSDALEIHGEWTRTRKRDRNRIRKAADGVDMGGTYLPARFEYAVDDRDREYDRFLLGGQYTFSNDINITIEFYRTTHGYDSDEWNLAEMGIEEAMTDDAWNEQNPPFNGSYGNPYAGFLMNTALAIQNDELRQNYLFFRFASGESDNNWEWEQVFILNLDDCSQLHQITLEKTWLDVLSTRLELILFRGDNQSEFGLIPHSESVSLQLSHVF